MVPQDQIGMRVFLHLPTSVLSHSQMRVLKKSSKLSKLTNYVLRRTSFWPTFTLTPRTTRQQQKQQQTRTTKDTISKHSMTVYYQSSYTLNVFSKTTSTQRCVWYCKCSICLLLITAVYFITLGSTISTIQVSKVVPSEHCKKPWEFQLTYVRSNVRT